MKGNGDKFRQHNDIDVWEENYCGISGVMAAAGAVAIFARSVSRLQDFVTHFVCHIWQHKTLRGVMSHMHCDKLSHIL